MTERETGVDRSTETGDVPVAEPIDGIGTGAVVEPVVPVEPPPPGSAAAVPGPETEPAGVDRPAVDRPAEAEPIEQPRTFWLLAVIALAVVILDLVTKLIAVATLTTGESPRILGGLVYFSLIRNAGAAFSMATGMTWILALVATAVVVMIIRIATRLRSTWWAVSLGLVLGGAIGNLIDRIFRSPGFFRGHVVDFISVFGPNAEHFPVFNVADSAITIGGILLVLTALQGVDFDGTRAERKKKTGKPSGG